MITHAPGYLLQAGHEEIDTQLFETFVRDGRRILAAGEPERAADVLAEALALWHGSPLADVPPSPLIEAQAALLTELRLDAAELRITAELACGGHVQVIPELKGLLADNPLREGLWLLLMKALDGSGQHTEALDAYSQAQKTIADELGVDPGPKLRLYAEFLAVESKQS